MGARAGTGSGIRLEMLGKVLGCLKSRAPHPELVWNAEKGGVLWFCSSPITEVNLSLSCPENSVGNQILILQSRANLTWSLSLKCHIQLLVC